MLVFDRGLSGRRHGRLDQPASARASNGIAARNDLILSLSQLFALVRIPTTYSPFSMPSYTSKSLFKTVELPPAQAFTSLLNEVKELSKKAREAVAASDSQDRSEGLIHFYHHYSMSGDARMKILCFASAVDIFPLIAFINFDYFLEVAKFDTALSSLFWTASKRLFTHNKKLEMREHPLSQNEELNFRCANHKRRHAGSFACLPWRVTVPDAVHVEDSEGLLSSPRPEPETTSTRMGGTLRGNVVSMFP